MILPTKAGDTIEVLQITDCHLGGLNGETLLGLDVDQSLNDVLTYIAAHETRPDLIIATGDIAGNAEAAAYQRFYQQVQEQLPGVPLQCLPGNHDRADVMTANLPEGSMDKTLQLGDWLLLMLDSTIPNKAHGQLCEQELEFLAGQLADNPDKHIVICLHHQPLAVGSSWVDAYLVGAAERFIAMVEAAPHVRAVLWGHVHQAFSAERGQAKFLAAPSTCIQFKPGSREFALDRQMPGYRWLQLGADGRCQSRVGRISQRDYPIDYDSNGY
ncbi:MAG: 3',5'-cyclic-AMP phosphodiesterase [Cellvibrionaceae bacterium]|nr:3',5'-cyclic-AMP phosphodiesterase [Cellvibrionaceae bacterium]MCV6624907.1 3',5'-cyclic-AMP phosphodiesterase [Cellvibrionaceae bacterium]